MVMLALKCYIILLTDIICFQERYLTGVFNIPTYNQRKNALKFFILLSITLQRGMYHELIFFCVMMGMHIYQFKYTVRI